MDRYKTFLKRLEVALIIFSLIYGTGIVGKYAVAAKQPVLNVKTLKLVVGENKILKIKNSKKKANWSVISGAKSVTLSSKKKNSVKVIAKKEGKAKIQAKIGKKKLVCKVTVIQKKNQETAKPSLSPSPSPVSSPEVSNIDRVTDDGIPHDIDEESKLKDILKRVNPKKSNSYEWREGHLVLLDISNNYFYYGDGLTGELDMTPFSKIEKLNCSGNKIDSLKLQDNTVLKSLICAETPLDRLEISNNLLLEELDCNSCEKLTMLDISNNKKIRRLRIEGCNDVAETVLKEARSLDLIELSCRGNNVEVLDVSVWPDLEVLDCGNVGLVRLDVSGNLKLKSLSCPFNLDLTEIKLGENTVLTEVDFSYCEFAAKKFFKLIQNLPITNLKCSNNDFSSIDIKGFTELKVFSCDGNPIDELDLSTNTKLESLSCSYCENLEQLDISKNTSLKELDISGCPAIAQQVIRASAEQRLNLISLSCWGAELTDLDVSTFSDLEILDCGENGLTKLDVSKNTKLISLICSYNQIAELDVSKNQNLLFLSYDKEKTKVIGWTEN